MIDIGVGTGEGSRIMGEAGWFDDPSGRFGKRWYDGARWSSHVVGANGTVTSDVLPEREEPYPPPAARQVPPTVPVPPPAYPGPVAPPYPPGHGFPYQGPAGPPARYRPGLGVGFAAAGLVAVAVSLFGPSWVKGGDSSFLKLAEGARKATLPDDADGDVVIAYAYFIWAAFLLFGLSVVFTVVGLVPVPPTSHSAGRIIGSVVAGTGGVMHAAAFGQIASDERTVAAYLGFGGWYVVLLGLVVGVRQVGAVSLTGQRRAVAPPPGAQP